MKTKDAIIRSTSELIKMKGYHGTAIQEIASRSSVPKGSLYHHFPGGKDELIEAALEEAAASMAISFKNAMKGKGSAINGLKAIVDVFIEDLKENKLKYGCPLAAVSMDVASENDAIRKSCSRLFDFWIYAIESYLKYKKVDDSKDKAEKFLIHLEGAILLSRVQQSDRPLKLIKKSMNKLIEE